VVERGLRIVFFGTPEFAVPSLEGLIASRHTVVTVVSQPDRPKGRGQQVQPTPTRRVADAHGIPVLQPAKIREEGFLQVIRDLAPDLGVVVAYGRLLPDALLAIPRLGMINVHASLLPRYRGAAPIQRAVLAGDAETGVTIMRVASEMDAGPTFSMRALPIPPDATSGDIEEPLARLGASLVLLTVDDLAGGRAIETPQDHARATHAAKITKAERTIDWAGTADIVHNLVRGLQPWPLASTTLDGDRLVIRQTAPLGTLGVKSAIRPSSDPVTIEHPNADLTPADRRNADLAPAPPGTVLRAEGDELVVACGGGTALRILELQPEGRRTMTAREFLAGRAVPAGTRLQP
jgi:methionyl-tRNA formyltransferase